MNHLAFQLGRETELSAAEIAAVLKREDSAATPKKRSGAVVFYELPERITAEALMRQLGGTVSVSERVLEKPSAPAIADFLAREMPDGKIHFSLRDFTGSTPGKAIKKLLKEEGRSARFIEWKNTATILHNRLHERGSALLVFPDGVYALRALQDIEAWSTRDYERPVRNPKRGMLPPKLARMLVNLSEAPMDAPLLDPFCGSGTVLTEARLLGYTRLYGTDADSMAVQDTKENMAWVEETHAPGPAEVSLFVSKAESLAAAQFHNNAIRAIVSEPYLGKPLRGSEPRSFLEKQTASLAVLYKDAFRAFSRILAPNAVVVFITPAFRFQNEFLPVPLSSAVRALGFSPYPFDGANMLSYMRPDQFVRRDIHRFVFHPLSR